MKQFILALLFPAACALAQPSGIVLVAKPGLPDPNFSETVLLVTRTDDGNPVPGNFPRYLILEHERNDDKRRAKMARHLLRNLHGVTFEKWQAVCLDTTIY